MKSDTSLPKFLELVRDVKEQLSYLNEIGVELYQDATWTEPKNATVLKATDRPDTAQSRAQNSVLERNAAAASLHAAAPRAEPLPKKVSTSEHRVRQQAGTSAIAMRQGLFEESLQQNRAGGAGPTESLEQIWADIGDCSRCPLCEGRTRVVNSEGNHKARVMFIGEAPGADEDAQGRPFVGRAGQLLSKIMESIGIKRDEVMIGNVNRCRPPQNRPPTPLEALTCRPFLLREIDVIRPEVIVVLGNTAVKNLLGASEGITRLRGKFQDYCGTKVMPTYHPAYLLRDPSKKRETWEDMKKVRDYLDANPSP